MPPPTISFFTSGISLTSASVVSRSKAIDEAFWARPQQRDAAARDDAFFDRRLGRVHRIFDACLLLLHLGVGGRTDLDDRHAADELPPGAPGASRGRSPT
jgi:hypothetical protein